MVPVGCLCLCSCLSFFVSVRLSAGRWWLVLCHLCGPGQFPGVGYKSVGSSLFCFSFSLRHSVPAAELGAAPSQLLMFSLCFLVEYVSLRSSFGEKIYI